MKKRFFILCVMVITVSGCMNAAVSGARVVYDRHNIKKTFNDHYTSLRAHHAIYANSKRFDNTHVSVKCYNGTILLTGQTPNASEKTAIEHIVRQVAADYQGDLYNRIEVASPSSTLTRMSDTWITTKITSQIIASDEIDPNQITVVTENGTVYLMGTVTPNQGNAAIEIARRTEGVQEVVKMFSWVHISKR